MGRLVSRTFQVHSLSHPHGSRAPNRQFLDSDTNCISPPQSHHGGKLVRTITSIMATRTSNPDHKALTNTTHDGSTKARALQSLSSLEQDTLNTRLSDCNNNKTDDHAARGQDNPFPSNRTPPVIHLSTNNESHGRPSLEGAVNSVFRGWHGKTARSWQVHACKEVLQRQLSRNPPSLLRPILLVRSTGGGKSAVRDVSGILCGPITITIVPLLSLAADQTSKLTELSLSRRLSNRLHVYNLDVIRSKNLNDLLRSHLEALPNNKTSKKRVFLFTSPQKLTRDPLWQQTISICCRNGTLRSVAIDECHLYASHGMEFRREFGELRKCLFHLMEKQLTAPIPILFMTATASQSMVDDLTTLTGLSFNPTQDLIWPANHSGVERRNLFLDLTFSEQPLRRIKRDLLKTSRAPGGRKIMVYSNSRKALMSLYAKSRAILNNVGSQKDILLVHGEMFREQKFHHTDIFVGQPLLDECPTNRRPLRFDPLAYFATAGTSSSGVDCPEVDRVLFQGFPQSIEDLLQCSGRCGRHDKANPSNSSFCMIVSLNSLVALMTRIFIIPKYERAKSNQSNDDGQSNAENGTQTSKPSASLTLSPDDLARRQWHNVLRVLDLVCLDKGQCIHFSLESMMVHPNQKRVIDLPTHCS